MFSWPDTPSSTTAKLMRLDDYGIITVSGENWLKFLQGQCSCDFNLLEKGQPLIGAHCNPKGRIICLFTAQQIDSNTIGLRVPLATSEAAVATLKRYAMFFRCDIQLDQGWKVLGSTEPLTSAEECNVLSNTLSFSHNDGRIEYWVNTENNQPQINAISQVSHHNTRDWECKRLTSGIAELTPALQENILPHELNMQLTGAISFTKGCYTGQEIIARMQHKAALKKHMYLIEITGEITEEQSTARQLELNGKKIGYLLNTTKTSDSQHLSLALCNDEAFEQDGVSISHSNEINIQWKQLPYAIT